MSNKRKRHKKKQSNARRQGLIAAGLITITVVAGIAAAVILYNQQKAENTGERINASEEKEGLVIKSMCDEGGHIVRGNGFVYVTVNTNYGGSFYKFLLPTEYWSNIKCKRGIPFINEALNSDEWFIPLARVERDD